jgi:hypothetical protein
MCARLGLQVPRSPLIQDSSTKMLFLLGAHTENRFTGNQSRMLAAGLAAKELLVQERARQLSCGQDTSQLYEREDSCKRWRAEYPATEEDKQEAKVRLSRFEAMVGNLQDLKLGEFEHEHTRRLQEQLSGVTGSGDAGVKLRARLAAMQQAHAGLSTMRVLHRPEFVVEQPGKYFLTYVRNEAAGTRTPMRTKGRLAPYDVGRVHGVLPLIRSTHMHTSHACEMQPRARVSRAPSHVRAARHRRAVDVCCTPTTRLRGYLAQGDPLRDAGDGRRLRRGLHCSRRQRRLRHGALADSRTPDVRGAAANQRCGACLVQARKVLAAW